ncbi:MAG: hypothetical protein V1837_02505 [Candidatus Woesearchaeota archaeon]
MKLKFWKKTEAAEQPEQPEEEEQAESQPDSRASSDLLAEFNRLRVKVESLDEIRKANAERFAHTSEQIGELRGMILDTNRTVSGIEVKITKTNDLVEAVQPDKLMVEVRKTDGKIEAVRANIESNEALLKTMVAELKDLRNKISFFRGLEQIVKLNEDIKKELTEIQKIKAVVERHADKSETLFSEMQNRFADLDKFSGQLKDLGDNIKQLNDSADKLKAQTAKKAEKQELERLVKKFNEFELHVGNVIDLMSKKAKELNDQFKSDTEKFQQLFDTELKRGKKIIDLIGELSRENPNLEKNLLAVEEMEKSQEEQKKAEQVVADLPAKKAWFTWPKKKKETEKPAPKPA